MVISGTRIMAVWGLTLLSGAGNTSASLRQKLLIS